MIKLLLYVDIVCLKSSVYIEGVMKTFGPNLMHNKVN
jgi:hypothetical protein